MTPQGPFLGGDASRTFQTALMCAREGWYTPATILHYAWRAEEAAMACRALAEELRQEASKHDPGDAE